MNKITLSDSPPDTLSLVRFIQMALCEDVGEGDHTSNACVPKAANGKAKLLIKEKGILAGQALAEMIFKETDPALTVSTFIHDSTPVNPGDIVLEVTGPEQSILKAERLVLNCMQRMSGIATATQRYMDLIQHTKARLLDTRKTTPGIRMLEKWAVRIGGGHNHRNGLYDMILIKDNHVDYAGGIRPAILAANKYIVDKNITLKIEIEVRNFTELDEVLNTRQVNRIMLDNFNPADLRKAVERIGNRFETEASGGINESNIRAYAETRVDFISVGSLTHNIKSLDMSLKAVK